MYVYMYEALPRTPHGLAFRYDHLHTYIHAHTYVNAYTYIHHVILTEVVLDAFDGLSGQVGKWEETVSSSSSLLLGKSPNLFPRSRQHVQPSSVVVRKKCMYWLVQYIVCNMKMQIKLSYIHPLYIHTFASSWAGRSRAVERRPWSLGHSWASRCSTFVCMYVRMYVLYVCVCVRVCM